MALKYADNWLSTEQYLAGENDAQVRHELIDGKAYAMTGASDKHNKISGNVFAEIKTAFKSKQSGCTPYINDMKVKVQQDFLYPDIMVVCDQQDNESEYYKTRPIVIIEVLSPATRRTDKTLKRLAYQSIESLQEYVLIEQDKAEIEVFTRDSGWQAHYYYLGDVITFASLDMTVAVEDIYYQVDIEDMRVFLQSRDEEERAGES
jgi:Uma2 family endonuclease